MEWKLYRVLYIRGGILWETSPWQSLEDCKAEVKRFNSLPIMSLERGGMYARIDDETI